MITTHQVLRRLPHKLLAILLLVSILAVLSIQSRFAKNTELACKKMLEEFSSNVFEKNTSDFIARAVFVYDYTNKNVLYKKNENEALPLASLAKLMTIRTAIKEGMSNDVIELSDNDLSAYGDTGFKNGDSIRVDKLFSAGIIASSNDAMEAIANHYKMGRGAFIDKMNDESRNLGLQSFSYLGPTGLDEEKYATAFGSAKDITNFFATNYFEHPHIFSSGSIRKEVISTETGREVDLQNTNTAIDDLQILIASKTGYTNFAGGNLSILWIAENGSLIGSTVLGSGQNERFSEMKKLHDLSNIFVKNIKYIPSQCKL